MAADVWKVKDMFGRVFIYESEKLFIRRMKLSVADYEDRMAWQQQHPNNVGVWKPNPPEAYRIENDVWVAQQLDNEMMKKYLEGRAVKRLKREARSRGYKV